MKLLKDTYNCMYGTMEVETEGGSILNSPVKFSIDYSLDFDDFPSDEMCQEVENCETLEEVLGLLEAVDCNQLSFNSFSLGHIYDPETDDYHSLELKIDFFTNVEQEEDIQDVGITYSDTFDELFEMIERI